MPVDRSFAWLGAFPPAVDLANTVIDSPRGPADLLETDRDLDAWIAAERPHVASAAAAAGHLPEVRELRDAVREALLASIDRRPIPARALDRVNGAVADVPVRPRLERDGTRTTVDSAGSDFARFGAVVARSLIELVAGPDRARLSTCSAPSCGMFFLLDHPRQRWCTPACGNRARVARHARRHRRG
jgi:predicted RNA-binding Zn ribbon-like protein